jgi:predicted DNA-binding antitoxin AbrB/MazE fold protein
MSKTIHAVFEKGVFRPLHPVRLPEACEVEFEPRLVPQPASMTNVFRVLSERFQSGENDVAARHNEHQP